MIHFALGFVSGLATAWAALAIWQRVPPLGPIDAIDQARYCRTERCAWAHSIPHVDCETSGLSSLRP